MRIGTVSRRRRAGIAAALLGVAMAAGFTGPAAGAGGKVHEFNLGTDRIRGTLLAPGDVAILPFRVLDGAPFTIQLRAARHSTLRPRFRVLGSDRLEDAGITAAIRIPPRGDRSLLRHWPAEGTGLRWLEVTGADGTTGAFELTSAVRLPRKASGTFELPVNEVASEFPFTAPGGALADITVAPARGSAAQPVWAGLVGPAGAQVLPASVVQRVRGFRVEDALLVFPGEYRLHMTSPVRGDVVVRARWRIPRAARRTLDAADVLADPVVFGIDPTGGTTADSLAVTLGVDFAQAGAAVSFLRPGTVVGVPAEAILQGDRSLAFPLSLVPFPAGAYDVRVVNPDGGEGTLADAFLVANAPAVPTGVSPGFGYDDETVSLQVTGSAFLGTAAVSLRRGGDTIAGTSVGGGNGLLFADFDLRGRTLGTWDVEVVNPGTPAALLPGAFEIRRGLTLASLDPANDLAGHAVDATVGGDGFVPGLTVRLVRAGGTPLAGGPATVGSPTDLTVPFDTTGAEVATWDLEVTRPDGHAAILPGAFRTTGRSGAVAAVADLPATAGAQGPPAAVFRSKAGQYVVGRIDFDPFGIVVHWTASLQRLDATGSALGATAAVSPNGALPAKRDIALAWNPDRDEVLAVWAEEVSVTPTQNGSPHPNGKGPVLVHQVMARRFQGADLAPVGKTVVVSSHEPFPAASANPWFADEFDSFRPSVAYDPANAAYEVAWMQAFDTGGTYSTDDFNVFSRRLDAATLDPGSLEEIADGPYHEGDPCVAWDPAGKRVLLAFAARNGSDKAPLDLLLGTTAGAKTVVSGSSDDLADPGIAVDPGSGRVLLSWTRVPAGGTRSVEALLVDGGDLATPIGTVQGLDDGVGREGFLARPSFNTALDAALVAWTARDSGTGAFSVLRRWVATGSDGATPLAAAGEISAGSGDEGAGTSLEAGDSGASAVLWLRSLTNAPEFAYPGSPFPDGGLRGNRIRMQVLR